MNPARIRWSLLATAAAASLPLATGVAITPPSAFLVVPPQQQLNTRLLLPLKQRSAVDGGSSRRPSPLPSPFFPRECPPCGSRDVRSSRWHRAAASDDDDGRSDGEEESSTTIARRADAEEESTRRALLAARLDLERRQRDKNKQENESSGGGGGDGDGGGGSIRIGIVGAGAVAFGTAAFLSCAGHDPMLWSPSGKGTDELVPSGEEGDPTPLTATGAVDAIVEPRVAASAEQLVRENDVLLIALPAYGHKAVFDALAPYVRDGQHVIIGSQASLGAVYLRQLLVERGVHDAPITAWGTTAVLARRTSGTEVNVLAVRKLIDTCTVPSERTESGLEVCRKLFGRDRFRPRDGLLAISLSNLNPQNHMGIALGNMSRMEKGERWSQGEMVTPNIGRLLEALDRERLDIADALDLEVRTIFEHFHLSFHVPIASISEMNRMMHERGNGGIGPDTGDSRYVTEDAPYGLVLTVELGKMTGRPAALHEAGVRIFSAMYGRDFEAENELLDALDLSRYNLDDLRRASKTGLLRSGVGERGK